MSAPTSGRKKAAKAPTRRASPPDTDTTETEAKTVAVYGDLHGGLTQIRASNVRLLLTFGEYSGGEDVLVPLVDWQTYGHKLAAGVEPAPDDRGDVLSSNLLSFDNLAFLLQDLSYDTREVVRLLSTQIRAGVAPVGDRIRYAARMLRLASNQLATAAEQMEGIELDGREAEVVDRPRRTLARPSRSTSAARRPKG